MKNVSDTEKPKSPKRIKQLSGHLINQIAAGEVIERPASVVKELVENSIDAGAKGVEIEISNGCLDIRVSDNGCGIEPDDIELAFTKHATSKIETGEDLFDINSLGFRGEALASIISIAKVICTTKTRDNETGTRVECEDSTVKKTEFGCAVGTTMEVKNLFYNTPVRAKFLKSEKVELSYVAEVLQGIAIANPDVSITLKHGSNTPIKTSGSGDLLYTLTEIYSNSIAAELKEMNKVDELSKIHAYGYCSTPDFTRSSKKSIYVFVNNRVVKCPIILKAIDVAYKSLLPNGKYPFICLNIDLPNNDVDVNVHPTKKEVRYKAPNQIFNFVISSINGALSAYKMNEPQPPVTNINGIQVKTYYPANYSPNSSSSSLLPKKSYNEENKTYQKDEEGEEGVVFISDEQMKEIEVINTSKFEEQIQFNIPEPSIVENKFKIIGQYRNTYIILEEDNELKIVDQHIADERFIYEKLMEETKTTAIPSQLLLISDIIHLEPADAALLAEHSDKLIRFGYEIQNISQTEIIFKKVPQVIAHIKTREILTDILENLSGDINNLEEKMLITMSCKAAVKAGQELNMWQMEELIKKWKTTELPYTCPHGRPIVKTFSEKEIASHFHRGV